MSRLAAWPVQKAIYSRLSGAVVIDSAQGAIPVYDHVPQDQPFPYIVIGDFTGSEWRTKTQDGDEPTCTLQVFSQYQGKSEASRILDEIVQTLTASLLDLSADTFASVDNRPEFYELFLEGDGRTYHGVLRFRLWVEDQV